MVDVRPNQLPSATTVTNTDKLVLDQGAAGVNSASPSELFDVFSPLASQAEAEQGTDNNKRMTPLRTKQSIASEIGTTIASAASGTLANSAVQSVNGKSGSAVTLVKADVGLGNADNTADILKPVSIAMQLALDDKFDEPNGNTSQYIRGNGSLETFPNIPQGTVTSVAVTVPTGLSVGGSPITGSGTFAITYASGYQGYTTTESTKLAGIATGAQVNTVASVAGKTGTVTLVKGDVGLGNVDNTSDAAKPVSTAQSTAIALKANNATTVTAGTGLTGGGDLSANRTVALNATSIASLVKADSALQASGGTTGQVLVKNSNATNDVTWATSEAATAVSYGPQTLTSAQQGQAIANIGAGTYNYNWIINGDFTVNQRGGVKKPANGVYGYDRWKGHANGIQQVIEALPAGEYTLTWTGGGNGTFGGVTATSPIKSTVTGGNTSVVVPESATMVSVVVGDATKKDPFYARHPSQEIELCQRYYEPLHIGYTGATTADAVYRIYSQPKRPKRAIPSMSFIAAIGLFRFPNTAPTMTVVNISSLYIEITATNTGTASYGYHNIALDAEIY